MSIPNLTEPNLPYGLKHVINVSGTMTHLGASIIVPEAIAAMSKVMPHFVKISDLQRRASEAIRRATNSEAGYITASAAAGITTSIAGAMTGANLAKIRQLPDTAGMKDEVVIQAGHMVNYGAAVEQGIRLAGARVVQVGEATDAESYQLEGKISERTAAALYVVSHHVVSYGQIPLPEFVEVCHARNVPVILDLASEYDLRGYLATGADIAIYSAHKFLGGPTAGIVAGRKDMVRAAYLQNFGIGRGMKVGKESIVGTIAALEAWQLRNHEEIRSRETSALKYWQSSVEGLPGVQASIVPDPTGNPLDRLRISIAPVEAGASALEIAEALAAGDPPVIVRDHQVEHGFFYLDPCNLHPQEEMLVAERLQQVLRSARNGQVAKRASISEHRADSIKATIAWPD